MKKFIALAFSVILLSGCSISSLKRTVRNILPQKSTEKLVREKIANNAQTLSLGEIISYDWEYIRFIRPYQTKTIYGETFEQKNDSTCQWVILGKNEQQNDVVLESFKIERELIDCIDLSDTTFDRSNAIFLIRDGKLKERKKFRR